MEKVMSNLITKKAWICFIFLLPNITMAHDYLAQSLESIIQRSTVIVEGQVLELHSERSRHHTTIEVVTISIREVINGQLEDRTIELRLTRLPYEDPNRPIFPHFEIGENVILHLKNINSRWIPIGHDQGKFSIIDGRIGQSQVTVAEFKVSIKEFATGKTDSAPVPELGCAP
ncbi:hypothetical protein [Rhodohalobacter sp. SW132]|uniref:hypothetical protein n=1 Tax=Rhodohalobacter sp. SW132 TaxID=2293433 RepID=UPI0011C03982|nr:hypothetical protein [Rhodohalobacter sp. SW132]